MLTYLPSASNVIACRVTGHLSAEEMEDISEKVLEAIERNEKTHVYAEIDGMTGFDIKAWSEQVQRAWPLLGKLRRFGRIAVVSDQPWIRWGTRIESALLPGISYEVFDLADRDRALAWVRGRVADPHESSLTILATNDQRVIAFEMAGRVSAQAMKAAVREIAARLEGADSRVRILGRFRDFRIPEPQGLFDPEYLKMKVAAFRKVERYAVVGGPSWFRTYIGALGPLFRFDMRYFDESDESLAWDWIGARPRSVADKTCTLTH